MTPTPDQMDALTEMINIGIGHGASVLNAMLNSHIMLQVPYIKFVDFHTLSEELRSLSEHNLAAIDMRFKGLFNGTAELMFPTEEATKLITALTGEEPLLEDIDALRAGTLCEVGNVVLNSVMGSISNILGLHFNYSVPNYLEGDYRNLWATDIVSDDAVILLARTRFTIEQFKTEGNIIIFLQLGAMAALLEAIDTYMQTQVGLT